MAQKKSTPQGHRQVIMLLLIMSDFGATHTRAVIENAIQLSHT